MAAQNDKKLAITEPSENDSSLCGYTEPDSLVHKPPTKKKPQQWISLELLYSKLHKFGHSSK